LTVDRELVTPVLGFFEPAGATPGSSSPMLLLLSWSTHPNVNTIHEKHQGYICYISELDS